MISVRSGIGTVKMFNVNFHMVISEGGNCIICLKRLFKRRILVGNLEAGKRFTYFIGFGLVYGITILFLDSLETGLEVRQAV